jgi:hypothetical protein
MMNANRLGQGAKGGRSGNCCAICHKGSRIRSSGIAADDRRILYPFVQGPNIVWIARGSISITAGRRAVLQRSTAIVKWNARSFPHLESFTGNLVYSKLGDIHGPTQVHGHLYYVSDLICTPAGDNVTSPNSGVNGPVAG